MTELKFHRDGWLQADVDSDDEFATLTRLKVSVGKSILTRTYSKRGGGESDALNVPLLPLANHLARVWWPLLYEPQRPTNDAAFLARHRLDLPMHGFVFPALAMCSAGDEAVLVDWELGDSEHSPVEFLCPSPAEPIQIDREGAEPVLMDVVETVLARLSPSSKSYADLKENWDRVSESMSTEGELSYCRAAGRLGFDPYDPDTPDLTVFVGDLPTDLFNDISDAADLTWLREATSWASEARHRLSSCPQVDVAAFGAPPVDSLNAPAWAVGREAARQLRSRLKLNQFKPKKAVAELLGAAVSPQHALAEKGPAAMTGLVNRTNGMANIGAVAHTSRQQRFRACAAAYIAWCTDPGEERAGTVALTRRQQASRAFAAEMLAPQEVLIERAHQRGFTSDDLEEEASDLIAPYETVLWQAWRANIPLVGVELPPPRRAGLF